MKRKGLALILALCCVFFLAACDDETEKNPDPTSSSGFSLPEDESFHQTDEETAEAIKTTYEVNYTDKDLDASWTENDHTITLSGQDVSITESGTYVVSGTLKDGQIVIAVSKEETVHLILNGVDITCIHSAPIYVKQAKKVIITLADGTTNTLTDGQSYVYDDAEKEEPNAALFSKGDLTINGEGTLVVNANFNNGIASKDKLKIISGTVIVNAANNGIKGKDCLVVKNGSVTVVAGGNGLKSDHEEDGAKGFILIENGDLTVTSEQDGIEAVSGIAVTGGEIHLTTGGGSENASSKPGNGGWGFRGGPGGSGTSNNETVSAKGMKADVEITVAGGIIVIDSSDDAIHSNDTVTIAGGSFQLASGDDGIHGDTSLTVSGGLINITKSYEGLEAVKITISGGSIYVVASDDGVNAAGGNDGSSMGRPGQNSFNNNSSCSMEISGGYLVVNAGGDGLDSNGSLTISGGTILVYGPTSSGDGALDADGTITVTGVFLLAVGSSGMAETPSASASTQPTLAITTSVNAGTLVHIEDEDGNEILTFVPLKNIQSIVFSSGDLKVGSTYTISTGGSCSGTAIDGVYTGGSYTGGTELTTMTLNAMVTAYGGMGGFGGGQGGRPGADPGGMGDFNGPGGMGGGPGGNPGGGGGRRP